jgi:hypothetical protein
MHRQWQDWALDWPLNVQRQQLKCLIKKVKKSGGEGGIQTHGQDALNQEVRKIYGFAVPCNPLASPDFAVDLAIGANSPFRTRHSPSPAAASGS